MDLRSIAMVGPDEGWAIRARDAEGASAGAARLHLHHGQWTLLSSPDDAPLDRVAMRTPHDGWILGTDDGFGSNVYLRYHDGAWTRVPGAVGYSIQDLVLSGATDGWAAAYRADARGHAIGANALHLEGDR